MKEVFSMWKDARMVALTAVITAVYMAALIPFKGFVLIPGFTEVRLASVLPVTFSLMFGPAAAWGSALGNLFSDAFGGTLTAGSVFGFMGNFFTGFVGYRLWGNLGRLSGDDEEPRMDSLRQLVEYVVVAFVAAAGTGAIIAWGLDLLNLFPFSVFAILITVNDFLAAAVIGPPLLYLLYPRMKAAGLTYPQLMNADDLPEVPVRRQRYAAVGLCVVTVSWLVVGIGISVVEGVPLGVLTGETTTATGGSLPQSVVGGIAFALILGLSFASGQRISSLVRRQSPEPQRV